MFEESIYIFFVLIITQMGKGCTRSRCVYDLFFTAVILSVSEEQLPEDFRFWLFFFPVTPLTLE